MKKHNLTNEILIAFDELSVFDALRNANIYKRNGVLTKEIFCVIFSLVFNSMSWSQLTKSKYKSDLPSKDSVYRFLSNCKFNWRTFLYTIAIKAISLIEPLTDSNRVNTFIIDDTPISRKKSKKTEMLSTIYDHVAHEHYRGYLDLTLGWSDGATFIPVDFCFTAQLGTLINDVKKGLDKRTISYKRQIEAKKQKNDLAVEMVKRALDKGIYADYVLMDTWFASPSMFKNMKSIGIDAVCMLKKTCKHYYTFGDVRMDILHLYQKATRNYSYTKQTQGILRPIIVEIDSKTKLKIVFVTNRNKKNEWIAIATTDTYLTEEEIIAIYGQRWAIEVFFKSVKSTFNLEKEFMIQSYDGLIAHTSIVYKRYTVTAWLLRKENDPKTLGQLFLLMCDDMQSIVYMDALCELLDLIEEISKELEEKIQQKINQKLQDWYKLLPEWLQEALMLSSNINTSQIIEE